MIKNIPIRLNADNRGHISSGRLVNGRPKSIEGFNIEDFAELLAVYGDDPVRLVLAFPVNDLATVFDDEYCSWGTGANGSTKKRTCNGEECVHRIDEVFCGERFVAGETSDCYCVNLPDGDKQKCQYSLVLRAMLLHPETHDYISPTVYTFRSHSINSGASIRSELIKALGITGRLVGHKFEFVVRVVQSAQRAGQKFPVWNLQAIAYADPQALLEANEQAQLTTGSELADALVEDDEPQQPAAQSKTPPANNGNASKTSKKESKSAPTERPPHDGKGEPPASVRTAEEVRAAAQAATANANKSALDQPTLAKVTSQLGILTGNTKRRIVAVTCWLFGATEINELTIAEADWLGEWIRPMKKGDQWLVPNVTLQEAKKVYAVAAVDLAPIFEAMDAAEAKASNTPDPNEALPDGLNAYGDPVDPQQGLELGAAKSQLDPAMM